MSRRNVLPESQEKAKDAEPKAMTPFERFTAAILGVPKREITKLEAQRKQKTEEDRKSDGR
jgi:hypothetical protein